LRRDLVLRQRAADRHDLEHRARLEDVAHGVVGLEVQRRRRIRVRIEPGLLSHREDRARMRVEDDRRRVLRMPLLHRPLEHLLGVRLDVAVERRKTLLPSRAGRS
jgi:hypothetical protein